MNAFGIFRPCALGSFSDVCMDATQIWTRVIRKSSIFGGAARGARRMDAAKLSLWLRFSGLEAEQLGFSLAQTIGCGNCGAEVCKS